MLARQEDTRPGNRILSLAPPRKHVGLSRLITYFLDTEVDLLGGIADDTGDVHLAAVLLDKRETVVPSVSGALADHGSLRFL